MDEMIYFLESHKSLACIWFKNEQYVYSFIMKNNKLGPPLKKKNEW